MATNGSFGMTIGDLRERIKNEPADRHVVVKVDGELEDPQTYTTYDEGQTGEVVFVFAQAGDED